MSSLNFCDMSTLGKLRISGAAAHDFVHIMFTADVTPLERLGGAVASLLLTGEGEVIDVVLIIRTGDDEYMVTTSAETVDEAFEWLNAHSAITDEAGAVFDGLAVTNETAALATVVLFGTGSRAVLDELSAQSFETAPRTGRLTMAQLDTVPVLALESPVLPGTGEVFELYCPPASVEGLMHALLSFPEIDPLTPADYRALRVAHGTWFAPATDAAYVRPHETGFAHLLRPQGDYVGARALECTGTL
jgi:glycine cleavage system aminomethyltransferase T